MKYIRESKELLNVYPRPIGIYQITFLRKFQKFLEVMFTIKRNMSYKDLVTLERELRPFSKTIYAKRFYDRVNKVIHHTDELKNITFRKFEVDHIIDNLLGDHDTSEIDDYFNTIKSHRREIDNNMMYNNPLDISGIDAFFSGGHRGGILQTFSENDAKTVADKDIGLFRFSYLPFPG